MADNGGNGAVRGLGDVRNLLGFLVAGFAGALNLLGLKSAEVGVILRNDSWRVSVISVFLLLGILAAVASVFISSGGAHAVSPLVASLVFVVLASLFSLSIWIIYSPAVTTKGEHTASIWVTVGLWAAAAVLLVYVVAVCVIAGPARLPAALPDLFNLQSLLLIAAVILTSIATYGALRLETISQTTPVAALGDTLATTGQVDTLGVSVSAAKLSTRDWLGINVVAVPDSWDLGRVCRKSTAWRNQHRVAVTCGQDPCYFARHALNMMCTQLSENVIPPDSSGAVHQTIDVLFPSTAYQHVQITAVTCAPPVTSAGKPKGTCEPIAAGGSSRLDLALGSGRKTGARG